MMHIWSALGATVVLAILGGCSPAGAEAEESEAKPTIHGVYEDRKGGADDQVVPGEVMSGPNMTTSMSLTLGEEGTVDMAVSMRGSERTRQGTWGVEDGTLLALDLGGGGPGGPGLLFAVCKDDLLKMSMPGVMLVLRKSAEPAEAGLAGVYTPDASEMSAPAARGNFVLRLEAGGRATLEVSRDPDSKPHVIGGDWKVEEAVPVVMTIDERPAILKYADDALTMPGPMGSTMIVHKRKRLTNTALADPAPDAGPELAADLAPKPALAAPTHLDVAPKPAITPAIKRKGVTPSTYTEAASAKPSASSPTDSDMSLDDILTLVGWSVQTIDLPAGLATGDELFLEFVKVGGVVHRSSILKDQKPWAGPQGSRALKIVLETGKFFPRAEGYLVPRMHCILVGEDWTRVWRHELPDIFDYRSPGWTHLYGDTPCSLGRLFGVVAGPDGVTAFPDEKPRGDDMYMRIVRTDREPSAAADAGASSAPAARPAADLSFTLADVGRIIGYDGPVRDMDSVEAALSIDCVTVVIDRAVPDRSKCLVEMVDGDTVQIVAEMRVSYQSADEPDKYWGAAKLVQPTTSSGDQQKFYSLFRGPNWSSSPRQHELPRDVEFAFVDAKSVALGEPFATAVDASGERADASSGAPFLRAVIRLPNKPAVDANIEAWALVDPDRADKATDVAYALSLARDALANSPGYLPLRETYAWALFSNGRFDEALAELTKAKDMGTADDALRYDGAQLRMRALIQAARGR